MIALINNLYNKINRPVNLMEVCGTHTVAIFKHGIRSLLPEGLRLLSGPGCPVCVTSIKDIDKAIAISMQPDVIFTTFGDMMRVPGAKKSLSEAKAEGADIRVVYSPLDCLKIAEENKDKKIVFFSAGFETTTPSVAGTIFEAERRQINNFLIYSVNKLVPPALDVLLQSDDVRIDGFIMPGHVSTIIGSKPYDFIASKYATPCVITGFGADDILAGITMLLKQIAEGRAAVEIQYKSVVTETGNKKAVEFINKYFEPCDSHWRGIGVLPNSGLRLRNEYKHRDAEVVFNIEVPELQEPKGCQCGLVLRGVKIPSECPLFGKACTPEKPIGACMVSMEGSCAAYYKYNI
ncbi:MAG TPA: hydrogenase formation protein HypD [Nitrospiraceae bacterium]|nr:MAG: hydrogenase formation protein HypD [Nitrospirae bacterium GWA2_46_11]OGW24180.1 MAG: hydrogenase formation protein HypD [Nitrospirae bacterium GWB2_47_37]HAK89709.1 hydrogenase formation protein HypD [Nitrospiraceae bacterium]HCZ10810.1 hydrogenase formation protein HypD [Nitrospiraceae bacterium]